MPGFSMTKKVAAPVDRVFDVFTDVEHAAGRIGGIVKTEMLTPGPIRVGTAFKETRMMFGKEATETMRFTAYEPGKMYTLEAVSCGAAFKSTFYFEPDGDATLVRFDLETKALSFFAKLFSPLAKLMMGTMKKCIEKDIDDMARFCESPHVAV